MKKFHKIAIFIQFIGIIYGVINQAYDVLVLALIFLLLSAFELKSKYKK